MPNKDVLYSFIQGGNRLTTQVINNFSSEHPVA